MLLVEIRAATVITQEIEWILRNEVPAVDDLAGSGGGDRARAEVQRGQRQRIGLGGDLACGKVLQSYLAQIAGCADEEAISGRAELSKNAIADGKVRQADGQSGEDAVAGIVYGLGI